MRKITNFALDIKFILMLEQPKAYKISEVSAQIQGALMKVYPNGLWIVGEIKKISQRRGHYYLELVESENGTTVAQLSAMIWSSDANYIIQTFRLGAQRELEVGINVMFFGFLQYHRLYGLKFHIKDVNPAYTLGDTLIHKKEIIERLAKEGLLDKNKKLRLPAVIQRIAVVSSKTAAGYQDFVKHLEDSKLGMRFTIKLFDAYMQGQYTKQTVIQALTQIETQAQNFDIVVIVRGGGSNVDLTAFDDEDIAKAIANFSLPVLTGIGHTRDRAIADMVAFEDLKTPTDVADYIITHNQRFISALTELNLRLSRAVEKYLSNNELILHTLQNRVIQASNDMIWRYKAKLNNMAVSLRQVTKLLKNKTINLHLVYQNLQNAISRSFEKERASLLQQQRDFASTVKNLIDSHKNSLDKLEIVIKQNDPAKILRQGFTMTLLDGKLIKSVEQVTQGSKIETITVDGKFISQVQQIKKIDTK